MPIIEGRYLLDTNVLIYATLERDERCVRANEAIERGADADCEAFMSVQNLAEMYPNLTGPKTQPPDSPTEAHEKIRQLSLLPHVEVLSVTPAVLRKALELAEREQIRRQKYFDMQLAATLILNDIPLLVTENESDFEGIPEIRVVNPFA